jgi:MYXO-CTERM domain-containing protein
MLLGLLTSLALAQTAVTPISQSAEAYGSGWLCGSADPLVASAGVTYSVSQNYVIALEDIEIRLEGRHRGCEVRINSAELRVDGRIVWSVSPALSGSGRGTSGWWVSETYRPSDIPDIVLEAGTRRVELVVRGTGQNENTAIRGTLIADLRYGRDWDSDGYANDLLADCGTGCSAEIFELHGGCPCDCDDYDSAINPGATEIPGDGADQDCDGLELCFQDLDGDRWRTDLTSASGDLSCTATTLAAATVPRLDCDDFDPTINPGATEIPGDGIDQDCDELELCFQDRDGDRWRTTTTVPSAILTCDADALAPASMPSIDCDDDDPAINPGATEIPGDGVDQDCDGREVCFEDLDGDRWRTDRTTPTPDIACAGPTVALASAPALDCDDLNAAINPGATEIWYDGVDQDCDGWSDFDQDFDGFDSDAHEQIDGFLGTDCDDLDPAVNPDATEVWYDGADQDCDGWSDFDQDFDGFDAYFHPRPDGGRGPDCDDEEPAIIPGSRGFDDACAPRVEQDGSRGLPEGARAPMATGCACASEGGRPWSMAALAAIALIRRRRAARPV